MRESTLFALLSGMAVATASVAAAETRFLAALDDLPLAPGLVETTDDVLTFTSPEGRIVETRAAGVGSPGAVVSYYRSALPSLGWTPAPGGSGLTFVRGRERLSLLIDEDAPNRTLVRFRMVTRQGPSVLE